MNNMSMNPGDISYARPELRDAFLKAVDTDDRKELMRLASDLSKCSIRLPGITREQLGLPVGATYGAAARHILSVSAQLASQTEPTTDSA